MRLASARLPISLRVLVAGIGAALLVGEGQLAGGSSAIGRCTPSWRVVKTEPKGGGPLNAVAVRGLYDGWAVGGSIAHWNGRKWNLALWSPTNVELTGVAIPSARSVWAAGGGGIAHWDGSSWRWVYTPAAVDLSDVVALPDHGAWAVGSRVANPAQRKTATAVWNGRIWKIVSSPNARADNTLVAVDGTSSKDLWAVGSTGRDIENGGPAQPLIEHWNGAHWKIVRSPRLSGSYNALDAVAARTVSEAWTVGTTNATNDAEPLIEHWDGSAWSVVTGPNVDGGELHGIVIVSADDVWAVGESPKGTLIEHWNGKAWKVVQNDAKYGVQLQAVAAASADDVWAVGDDGAAHGGGSLIEHYACRS